MRITLISHSYLAKENRKQLDELAKYAQIDVISPRLTESMLPYFGEKKRVIIGDNWAMHTFLRLKPLHSYYFILSIDLNLLHFKPDLVHIEYEPWHPLFIQTVLTMQFFKMCIPIVSTIKQNTYREYGLFFTSIKDWIGKKNCKIVSRFLACSTGVAEIFQSRFKIPENKIAYITQLGVDVNLFNPACDDIKMHLRKQWGFDVSKRLVGYCGKFVEKKGILDLISAVHQLRQEMASDVHLALLGDGPLKNILIKLCAKFKWLSLKSTVPHDRVADFLKCLDIFTLPSRIEKNWMEQDAHALIEALATGLPCIGTTSGTIPEILNNVGLVIPASSILALKDALKTLIQNSQMQKKFSESGRERVLSRYSLQVITKQRYEVYSDVLRYERTK